MNVNLPQFIATHPGKSCPSFEGGSCKRINDELGWSCLVRPQLCQLCVDKPDDPESDYFRKAMIQGVLKRVGEIFEHYSESIRATFLERHATPEQRERLSAAVILKEPEGCSGCRRKKAG